MSFRKYPVSNYRQKTGRLLPHRIGQILKELGCTQRFGVRIWVNPKQGNDLDFKVWLDDALVLVGEVLNWSIGSNMSVHRCNNIISNLLSYNCHKILIYTVPLERKYWLKIRMNGIDTVRIGYQLLPKPFYGFFKFKNKSTRRKVDSKETKADIKAKISQYLRNKAILACRVYSIA